MKEKINNLLTLNILFTVLLIFIVRLILSTLPSFQIDMGTWLSWANRLRDVGLPNFYSDTTWTQYTPGFLYWLFILGKLGWVSELAIKIPVIVADIFAGGVVWLLIRKVDQKLANVGFFLYVLNPAVIFNGSVWGQIDGILTLFLLLAVYFLVERKNVVLSFVFWGIAFLVKPQALAILPVLLVACIARKKFKEAVFGIVAALGTIIVFSLPFFPKNPILGIFELVGKMAGYYSFTSLFAFNFWEFVGGWKPDGSQFLGIPLFVWGGLLLGGGLSLAIFKLRKKLGEKSSVYLLSSLAAFSFFLFPTRVHERYLFPALVFLLIYAALKKSKGLFLIFGIVSVLHLVNLYYPYAYYENTSNFLKVEFLESLAGGLAKLIALGLLMSFFTIVFWDKLAIDRKLSIFTKEFLQSPKNKGKTSVFPKVTLPQKSLGLLLGLTITFSLLTRLFALESPKGEYFDEVYHAFTARSVLHADPKAWEWWNKNPEGFAYEWTHPPFAKLAMAGSMKIFGESSFGWRLPGAIFGTLSVFLVYLIAKEIFKDEMVGLLSAGVFALEGLILVMSRIGMNDIYLLTFSLAALYFFLRNKLFFSALAFGLALSSKWSAIWLLPILFVAQIVFKKKLKLGYLAFVILPPLVYLATYIPMFLTSHGFDIFIGVQKQMWWYHTGLNASHSYTSPWWTWPFLIRPIYLYTSDEIGGMVSRIYAAGNPLVFWSGLVAVVYGSYISFIQKNKILGFLIFSYLAFFVPWAVSPRIMFLYHYLPSLPFLAIILAFLLRKNPKFIPYFFIFSFILFIYFYPHWAGIEVPLWLDRSYYWLGTWR